ncbi:MAG: glycosyltransferase [Solirubrobacterales bacterium]
MPNPESPTFAVVVPATAGPPTLERCVAALRRAGCRPQELVVQRRPAGAGPAAARNLGAAACEAEVVAFVDADVEVHPDALDRLRAAFAADPGLTAVFGAYDDRPAAPGAVSRFRNLLHHHVHATAAGPAETFWAGLGAVRRDAFLAADGFDAERYPAPAVEDIELGMRLRAGAARIELDPRIRGTHLKRWSLAGMLWTDFARRGVPWVRLQLEARRAGGTLNLAPRHRASTIACLAAAAALVARRPLAAGACGALLAALNASFYRLLARRGGPALLAAGIPLHALHHLAGAASAAAGVAAHLLSRGRS